MLRRYVGGVFQPFTNQKAGLMQHAEIEKERYERSSHWGRPRALLFMHMHGIMGYRKRTQRWNTGRVLVTEFFLKSLCVCVCVCVCVRVCVCVCLCVGVCVGVC